MFHVAQISVCCNLALLRRQERKKDPSSWGKTNVLFSLTTE